ncbi:cytidine deaminase-like protein [Crucibulum laeve]|uniref:Deoxycytidylate deaminase n=1 Tax=Crucibulum laeve TaxID=68775 RepID=A0A5C3LWQ2_9AGAR|nr:cytidine deaminase-like protein [Crucibulum laeve]
MFIAIIGTRYAGKTSVEDYLVSSKGFTPLRLIRSAGDSIKDSESEVLDSRCSSSGSTTTLSTVSEFSPAQAAAKHLSFLSMSPLPSPAPTSVRMSNQPLCFSSPEELLRFVTRNWQDHFVTADLRTRDLVESFVKRPFFLLLSVDAPLYERFQRSQNLQFSTLEEFVLEDDRAVFGNEPLANSKTSLQSMSDLVNIQITNSYPSVSDLRLYLDRLDLLDSEHLRPGWDAYFMTLASLASRRSNCMKRRVGAVLVRENRVLATGYNGTPRGLLNCNEGGCYHCNGTSIPTGSFECVCLHAEENALLEAGRERIGENAVLYCNTCPCLKCTVKIIQTGVKAVVYNLTYKVDDASAALFKQAGVQLRRYDPNNKFRLPPVDDQVEALSFLIPGTGHSHS